MQLDDSKNASACACCPVPRSVAPTSAGEQLIGRLRPALGDVASIDPSRRQQPAALSALIDTLRMEDGRT
jgi:hypothetical protein